MKIDEFVKAFAAEFEDIDGDSFTPQTVYKELEEWDSLSVLSIVAIVDELFNKKITGADLKLCNTIEDLHKYILLK